MGGCSVHGCFNRRGDKGITFHKFPSDPLRRVTWLQNCGRARWDPPKSACICNEHFEESQFELHRADGWKKLKPNAIPTLFPVAGASARRRRRSKKMKTLSKYTPGKKEDSVANFSSGKSAGLKVQLMKRNKRKTTIPARWRGFHIESNIIKHEEEGDLVDWSNAESANNATTPGSVNLTSSEDHEYARHDAVEMVEVCFSGMKQIEDYECSQCIQLKETLANVLDERDALQKKINCINSAVRMVLNKEQRQTLRAVANTISENWILPENE